MLVCLIGFCLYVTVVSQICHVHVSVQQCAYEQIKETESFKHHRNEGKIRFAEPEMQHNSVAEQSYIPQI